MPQNYNAEIDDGTDLYPAVINESDIPPGSIPRFMRGQWRHLLFKDKDGKYHAAKIAEATAETITPGDLYDCLVDDHSYKLFCNKEHPGKKWATIGLYVIIGLLLFFLFMIWAANLDKNPVQPAAMEFFIYGIA